MKKFIGILGLLAVLAAMSMETSGRIQALVAENLRRYVAGEPLLSVVDVKRGY